MSVRFNQQRVATRGEGHRRCRMERLEARLALDGEGGTLVSVDPHFTLSFADDGTLVAGEPNNLNGLFDFATTAQWKEQILRGFQTWAVLTNADIGLVSDGGQPFGTPGSGRGDDRFGDIRVGSIAAEQGVGGVSVPVNNLISGTWLADVLFNSQFNYDADPAVAIDEVLAIAMHEAGNVFGLSDNTDPNSPLYPFSTTVKSPTSADIAALQSLHGTRLPDGNEVHDNDGGPQTDNDSTAAAFELRLGETESDVEGSAPTVIYGDISTASDVDYFSIPTPSDYFGSMTVVLRSSGMSLLKPELSVLNASGETIATASSFTNGGATLTLQVPAVAPGEQYYLQAAASTADLFGVGGYSLSVTFDGLNQVDDGFIEHVAGGQFRFLPSDEIAKLFDADEDDLFNDDNHSDDDVEFGMELDTTFGFVEGTRYDVTASISDSTDIDYYTVESPELNVGNLNVMTVAVHSIDQGGLVPSLTILDDSFQPVPTEVIANGSGDLVMQAQGLDLGNEYYVAVAAADAGGPFDTGNYDLQINFTDAPVTLTSQASGVLDAASVQRIHTLHVAQPQLFHFVLEAGAASTSTPTAIIATVKNGTGDVVTRLAAAPGDRRSQSAVLLNPGTYTADFAAYSLDGSLPPTISYNLLATSISDPFAGDPTDPTGHPFECSDMSGLFCYPGGLDPTDDPFVWEEFIGTLSTQPPDLPLDDLVQLLMGDWWSWVWSEPGTNGPTLAQDDYFVYSLGGATPGLPTDANILSNDVDPEDESFIALLETSPTNGTLSLDNSGSFSYTPNGGFVGTDQFSYYAYDFNQMSLVPGVVRIVVATGVTGDFDGSGAVDTADHDAWASTFGSMNQLEADGDRNGVISLADFTVWRDHLNESPPASLNVSAATRDESSSLETTAEPANAAQISAGFVPTDSLQKLIEDPSMVRGGRKTEPYSTFTSDKPSQVLLVSNQHGVPMQYTRQHFQANMPKLYRSRDEVFSNWPKDLLDQTLAEAIARELDDETQGLR